MKFVPPKIFGILNLTEDSFSDGGLYFDTKAAISHARRLYAEGADVIDLGAASSHPDSQEVSIQIEIDRLAPLMVALQKEEIPFSVDSWRPEVQKEAITAGASYINDISAFPHPEIYADLAASSVQLVLMYAAQNYRGPLKSAPSVDPQLFFRRRIRELCDAGIDRGRLILDPGMGLFLSANPEASVVALRGLEELRAALNLPVLVSVSRKSFLGAITGKDVDSRGAATLAAEIFAATHGAHFIRTHDVASLKTASLVFDALS